MTARMPARVHACMYVRMHDARMHVALVYVHACVSLCMCPCVYAGVASGFLQVRKVREGHKNCLLPNPRDFTPSFCQVTCSKLLLSTSLTVTRNHVSSSGQYASASSPAFRNSRSQRLASLRALPWPGRCQPAQGVAS